MTDAQQKEMFLDAIRHLLLYTKIELPPNTVDRHLTSLFACHLMKAEGRKRYHMLTRTHKRWVRGHQDELNQAHSDFCVFLRFWVAEGQKMETERLEAILKQQKYLN
jgi:DNA-binding transcriptional ArsR family regulator